jgi:hypothetical protein
MRPEKGDGMFDTTRVPDDPAYWDALAERITVYAAREGGGSLEWLTQSRAGWVAACLLLGAALFSMASSEGAASAPSADWFRALAPADSLGRDITTAEEPPAIGELLLARTPGGA